MMEAEWSSRRVTRQIGLLDLTVMKFWDQWTEEMSFTWRPGSGGPRQTSRQETRHIVRHARIQPTASLVTVQTQAVSSRQAPVSSRIIGRRLAGRHLVSRRPLSVLPMTPSNEAFVWSGDAHDRIGLQWNGFRSSSAKERYVSRHNTELAYLNAHSYRFVLEGSNKVLKLPFL
ncbi:transposable element Tcb1 transposase [Trichonephila clavipes]|nr:transposable element Tcb1 transposase [Trichonephila clavipes]